MTDNTPQHPDYDNTIRYGERVDGDRRKNVCVTLRASVHTTLRELAQARGCSASSIIEALIEQECDCAA